MTDLSPDEAIDETVRDLSDGFSEAFREQHPSSKLKMCVGTLERALKQSIHHEEFVSVMDSSMIIR